MRSTREQERQEPAHAEMGCLISCVRRRHDASAPAPDARGVDWDRWLDLAMRHRVVPVLHGQLSAADEWIPSAVRAKLKDLYLSNAARNMGRVEELKRLAALCDGQALPVMFVRGPVLASTLYGDLSLRQFTDLDLLVHACDVSRLSEILVAEGYEPHFRLNGMQEKALIRYRTERCFIRSQDRSVVDVHWRLLPGFYSFEKDESALWSRSVTASLEGVLVRTLGQEDMFLFLCAHGAKHGWDQLSLLCDLAEMIRVAGELDWEGVLARAEGAGKRRMVVVALALVREVLGVMVPVNANGDGAVRALVEELKARLGEGVGCQQGGGGETWRLAWKMMTSLKDRLAFAADLVLTPTGIECEKARLSAKLFFVYRLLRLGRIAGRLFSRRSDRQES